MSLETSVKMVGEWCNKNQNELEARYKESIENLNGLTEQVAILKAKSKEFSSLEHANQQRLVVEQQKVNELNVILEALQHSKAGAEKENKHIQEKKVETVCKLDETEKILLREKQKTTFTVDQLTRGALLYKKLGLEFEKVGKSRLKLNFTQIDPMDHERLFFFLVFVDQNDKYHVEQVEPVVEDVEILLRDLNASNDFSQFVKSMRTRFQSLCLET